MPRFPGRYGPSSAGGRILLPSRYKIPTTPYPRSGGFLKSRLGSQILRYSVRKGVGRVMVGSSGCGAIRRQYRERAYFQRLVFMRFTISG